jgi:hypothetical protein
LAKDYTEAETLAKAVWNGPPPLPKPYPVVHDLSCQGPMAFALRDALQEVAHEEEQQQQRPVILVSQVESDRILTQPAMDRILQSVGDAILESQQQSRAAEHQANTTTTLDRKNNSKSDATSFIAPAILLRGRVKHWNRLASKWRFAVENVELKERQPLARNRLRRSRPSLWSTVPKDKKEEEEEELVVVRCPEMEILAYNDIE